MSRSQLQLDTVRIVLVETSHPGNIGGVARAMKNMGLTHLTLVNPKRFPDLEATQRASGADDILQQALCVPDLETALAETHFVLGTSARSRHLPWPLINPRQMAQAVKETLQQQANSQIALVFGREDRGLTNEELSRCHAHVHIPTQADFSSLNLAAAVQVLGYELRMACIEAGPQEDLAHPWGTPWDAPLASSQALEGFFAHLEQTLIDIEFHDPQMPRQLMTRLRRLYLRARPDCTEVNILRGIQTATQKCARLRTEKAK